MTEPAQTVVEIVSSIAKMNASEWNALTAGMPLLSHAFLAALETSYSVGEGTGWQPSIMVVREGQTLVGAVPLYIKSHSYGEYVFDWAWADAYQQNGLAYYPKLLVAIPFSPITSTRLLANNSATKQLLIEALESVMQQHEISSAHVLFLEGDDAAVLAQAGWLKRTGVQFRWENEAYASFDHFLQSLNHNKRKKNPPGT